MASKSLKGQYDALAALREPFLRRGRDYSALTIPSILPMAGFTHTQDLPEPYQGFGARAVTNLAAKLLMVLLPVGTPFMRLGVDNKALIKAKTQDVPPELAQGLAMSTKLIEAEVEARQWRQPTDLGLQHLIITGNVLEQMLPDNKLRIFPLSQYVVQRDSAGNILRVIIHERVAAIALPPAAQAIAGDDEEEVDLLTGYIRRPDGSYQSWQEIGDGQEIPGSAGTYRNSALLPVWPLRWSTVSGEDYGRSKVEDHIGDLRSLESYRKSMIEGAAMASRHITLVRPNASAGNLRQRLAKANNGAVLAAHPDDVTMLQFQNVAGLQIVQQEIAALLPQLSAAFLLVSDMRRDAERVTATELRMLAEELESALGGVYSTLAAEQQLPRATRLIYQMQRQGSLPEWGADQIQPRVSTGLDALGKSEELNRVVQAGQIAAEMGPEAQARVKYTVLLGTAFNALGLPNAVKSDTEVQREQAQQAAMAAAQQGGAAALGAMGQAAVQQGQA
jgi:hypothetical protein